MGIFDNLFGVFTGEPQIQAAGNQREFLGEMYRDVRGILGGTQNIGTQLYGGALDAGLEALPQSFRQAQSDLYGGLGNAVSDYQNWGQAASDQMLSQLQGGLGSLQTGLGGALSSWDELEQVGQRYGREAQHTGQLSADAMGLNGPEGIARAQGAFQAGPGFNFALNTGLESIARNANAAGMLASGNQMQESQRYGTGLAQQEYNNWLRNLQQREGLYTGLEGQTLGAAEAGQANAYLQSTGQMGNLYNSMGQILSNINLTTGGRAGDAEQTYARIMSEMSRQYGPQIANLYMQSTQGQAQLMQALALGQVNLASSFGSGIAQTFANEANAQTQAGQATTNLLGSIGRALANIF